MAGKEDNMASKNPKGDAKKYSNTRTIALISHASSFCSKILHQGLEPHMAQEMHDIQAGNRKTSTRDASAYCIRWLLEQSKRFQRKISLCFMD